VLVTQNDYQLSLFNGDVGIVFPDTASGGLGACFAAADGSARVLAPSRLPPHETVFAMTVHKSQGSEFDDVAVVLPDERSPLLGRELLYTAVTRARRSVTLYADEAAVRAAVARRVERASGLGELLWGS
jgi:exodeoxyribonuclease V alpha subunit